MLDPDGNTPATRPDGWYWVMRKDPFTSNVERWVPAFWSARFFVWSSVDFVGMPDTGLAEIGERIQRYGERRTTNNTAAGATA